ncbi:MAG: sigma 54-interacting transcriptional regulator [Terriglobales bacterium]
MGVDIVLLYSGRASSKGNDAVIISEFPNDEVAANLGLQSRPLPVLQERSVQRLGERAARKIDFLLITAPNDDYLIGRDGAVRGKA